MKWTAKRASPFVNKDLFGDQEQVACVIEWADGAEEPQIVAYTQIEKATDLAFTYLSACDSNMLLRKGKEAGSPQTSQATQSLVSFLSKSQSPPKNLEGRLRDFRVKDPDGNTLDVFTYLKT